MGTKMKNSESRKIGGIPVRQVNLQENISVSQLLGREPYCYELVSLAAGESLHLEGATRYCIYVLATEVPVQINEFVVPLDSYVLGEAAAVHLYVPSGATQLLLASQKVNGCSEPLRQIQVEEAKKVDKPWGDEVWLTGDPSSVFAFKRILLKAGNRTSLQYHRHKRETNFIISGQANLHFSVHEDGVPADQVTIDMIATAPLSGPVVADVFPGLVHRLEAISDLLLFEVSTPELDDVIRIQDETGRSHGRIHHEHG